MKALLTLVLLAFATQPVSATTFDHRQAQEAVAKRLAAGDNLNLAAEAYDQMFDVAGKMLHRRGEHEMAAQLDAEWSGHYRLALLGAIQDTGDHAPLSEWVQGWYAKLEAKLGVQVMEWTHLRDIWVLNFTLPVTFHPQASETWCVEDLANHPDDTCEAEYRRHFAGTKYAGVDPYATAVLHHGFAGVVTYWVVWGACEAATYGTGWFIVCTPAGMLAEIAIEKYVAPKASDAIYERANR